MMNNENGRSMVEMLGVLAIIGVLSVAGIAGYSMAMNKYRANEVLNTASQVVILARAQAETGGNATNVKNTDVGISAPYGSVVITVTDASQNAPTVTVTGAGTEPCKAIQAGDVATLFEVTSCS